MDRAESCGTPEASAVTSPTMSTVPPCVTKKHMVQCPVARGMLALQKLMLALQKHQQQGPLLVPHLIHDELQDIIAFVRRVVRCSITLTCAQCNTTLQSQGTLAHLTCPNCKSILCQLCNCRLLHLVQLPAIEERACPRVGRLYRYMPSNDQGVNEADAATNANAADNTHAETAARAGLAWMSQHFGDAISSGKLYSSAFEMYGKLPCWPVLRSLCQRIPTVFPPLEPHSVTSSTHDSMYVDSSSDSDASFYVDSDDDSDSDDDTNSNIDIDTDSDSNSDSVSVSVSVSDSNSDSDAYDGRAVAMATNRTHPARVYRQVAALGRVLFEVPRDVMQAIARLDADLVTQLLVPNWPWVDVNVLVVAAAIHNVVHITWPTAKPAQVLTKGRSPSPWWPRCRGPQVNMRDAPISLMADPLFGHWLTDVLHACAPGSTTRSPAAITGTVAPAEAAAAASAGFIGTSLSMDEYADMAAYRMQHANFDPTVPAMPWNDLVLDETGTDYSVSSDTEDEQQAQSVGDTLDTWSTTSGSTSRSHGSHRHSAPRSAA